MWNNAILLGEKKRSSFVALRGRFESIWKVALAQVNLLKKMHEVSEWEKSYLSRYK